MQQSKDNIHETKETIYKHKGKSFLIWAVLQSTAKGFLNQHCSLQQCPHLNDLKYSKLDFCDVLEL